MIVEFIEDIVIDDPAMLKVKYALEYLEEALKQRHEIPKESLWLIEVIAKPALERASNGQR